MINKLTGSPWGNFLPIRSFLKEHLQAWKPAHGGSLLCVVVAGGCCQLGLERKVSSWDWKFKRESLLVDIVVLSICWDIQNKSTEPCLVLAGTRLPKGIAFLAKDSDDFVKGCWWRVMVGWQKLWGLDRIGTSGDSGWRSSFSWGFACGDEIPESWKKAPSAKTCSSRV